MKIPKHFLIQDMRNVAEELGETPTSVEYNERGKYSHMTIVNQFGSWNSGVKAAGLSPNREVLHGELLEDIQKVADELGKTPSQEEYNDLGEHSAGTVKRKFGDWMKALREAGVGQDQV